MTYDAYFLLFNIFTIFDIFCSRLRGKHDVLVPVTPYLAGIFQYLRKNKKLPPRVKLPCFSFDGICYIGDGFHLRMWWMSKKWLDLVTSKYISCIFYIFCIFIIFQLYYVYLTYSFDLFRYQEQCLVVFPFKNKHDHPFMATGKNHSIRHTPTDVINYCDAINASCEAPETAHKDWVKEQGVCTNQGPHVQLTMMMHSLRKETAALLCEGVQGNTIHILHIWRILHMLHILYIVFCKCQ